MSFTHLWYHVTMERPKDILWLLLERNKTITTCNIWIKDDHYEFAAMRKPYMAISAYTSKVMCSATGAWKQDIKKPLGSFCDLTQWNTLVTNEMHVIILLKNFNHALSTKIKIFYWKSTSRIMSLRLMAMQINASACLSTLPCENN